MRDTVVAFVSGQQAYVLHRVVGASGLVITSQPKFVSVDEAKFLSSLNPPPHVAAWIKNCERAPLLRGFVDLQRVFCWWMGLAQTERDEFFID